MKSISYLHRLVRRKLRQFNRSHSPAWVSSMFALSLLLPLCLVGSCKEGASIALPDIGKAYAMSYNAGSALTPAVYTQNKANDGAQSVHISKSMIKAHKRQMRSLLKGSTDAINHLQKGEVYLLFSRPELARYDGSVSSWQYRSEHCVVDIFFAKDEASKIDRVVHYEIRQRQVARFVSEKGEGASNYSASEQSKCLATLLDHNKIDSDLSQIKVSSLVE